MKTIIRGRRAGKTYELIKQAAEENLYIICVNQTQAHSIAAQATQLGFTIPFPLTWSDFVTKRYYGRNINGFLIDNLDMCIQSMTPVEIKTVSLNGVAE